MFAAQLDWAAQAGFKKKSIYKNKNLNKQEEYDILRVMAMLTEKKCLMQL